MEDIVFEDSVITQTPPESAVVGEWLIVSVIKLGFQAEERQGVEKTNFWLSTETPFGMEAKLALPLVENPSTLPPEGTITGEQLALAVRAEHDIYLKSKKVSLE